MQQKRFRIRLDDSSRCDGGQGWSGHRLCFPKEPRHTSEVIRLFLPGQMTVTLRTHREVWRASQGPCTTDGSRGTADYVHRGVTAAQL